MVEVVTHSLVLLQRSGAAAFGALTATEQQQKWLAAMVTARKDKALSVTKKVEDCYAKIVTAHQQLIIEGLAGIDPKAKHAYSKTVTIDTVCSKSDRWADDISFHRQLH